MVIFNSHVKLPDGIVCKLAVNWLWYPSDSKNRPEVDSYSHFGEHVFFYNMDIYI